jgi:hypothetical protein
MKKLRRAMLKYPGVGQRSVEGAVSVGVCDEHRTSRLLYLDNLDAAG